MARQALLEPFLPVPRVRKDGDRYYLNFNIPLTIGRLQSFLSNFAVLVRAFTYTRTMGSDLKAATEAAVLNANYVKAKLRGDYNLPFPQPSLHEVIFNDEEQKKNGVTTMDIAKRLLDCGFSVDRKSVV